MRRTLLTLIVALALASTTVAGGPPSRPLPLTHEQFVQLHQLERQAENVNVLGLRASYESDHHKTMEATRLGNDISTFAAEAGMITALTLILICAAPL